MSITEKKKCFSFKILPYLYALNRQGDGFFSCTEFLFEFESENNPCSLYHANVGWDDHHDFMRLFKREM